MEDKMMQTNLLAALVIGIIFLFFALYMTYEDWIMSVRKKFKRRIKMEPVTKHYYIQDSKDGVLVTVAVRFDGKNYSRGIAIRSKKDQSSKKIGTNVAIGRLDKIDDIIQRNRDEYPLDFRKKIFLRLKNNQYSKVQGLPLKKVNKKCELTPYEEKCLKFVPGELDSENSNEPDTFDSAIQTGQDI